MEGDRYVLADEVGTVEEHTLNALVRFDEDGNVKSLRLKDAFYHEVYPWENLEMDPKDIMKEGMFAGSVPGLDAEGHAIEIPVTLIPTAYAGARDNLNPDEFGQTRLRGLEVAAPTVENLLNDRRKAQALVNQILGLDESGWDVIRKVLAQEVDAAAADAHNVGWKRSKDRDFADPTNPFVGWGPKRVRVSDETKAMTREALEAHVGAAVSEEKYQAMRAAKNGMDITHNLYRLYDEVVRAEADGGNRFAGKNALPLLTLIAYLADWRGQEAGTKVGIAQVLAGLMEGSDEEGLQMLDRLQALAFKAGELVYGERGTDGEVVEMAPTGRKLPRKARTDFGPYADLSRTVQELDGYTLAPAAKWFARRLGIDAVAA